MSDPKSVAPTSNKSLADHVTPLAAEASSSARERVDDWLKEISDTESGRALATLFRTVPAVRLLIDSLADGSRYLFDLVRLDSARLHCILTSDADARFRKLLAETATSVLRSDNEADVMRLLRRMKAEAALLIAIADIGGVWPVMRVTSALTELADVAISSATRFLLAGALRAGKINPVNVEAPDGGCGFIVLAMGKMGAHELNYSSDIDLITLFDPTAPAIANGVEPATLFIRITRRLVKLLQERTADGYVFRVDLRLRPDPASTQVAISIDAALSYYESAGQNWERAAMIKARPCAGDIAAGERFLREITPFIWRKYLDFAAVADVHAMKRQIHAYKGHEEIAVDGHNLKLGRGGIREIEFFVQTQQLIAGGRDPGLRGRQTLPTLNDLAQAQWIGADSVTDLRQAYLFLRRIEHRLQMVADEQTHTLPSGAEELGRFARFAGFSSRDEFAADLLNHLRKVQHHYARLFEDQPALAGVLANLTFPPENDDRDTLDTLHRFGYRKPREASRIVRQWLAGHHASLRGVSARGHLIELLPVLLTQLSRSENPDGALLSLDRFFGSLHGGLRLLSLLRRNSDLVALLASILGTAPRLAEIVAAQPQVMDALLDPTFFGALPDEAKLGAALTMSLAQSNQYEDFLDRARQFGHEHMFLIGARILSRTLSAQQAGDAFARLSDVLIRAMHRAIEERFVAQHGGIRGQESAVLALGKLGGREMTAGSDLDLIVIYDFDPAHPESDGAKPLYGAQYFARMTQRLINALTTRTNFGALYDVDMRLRPSGRSGPVATSIDSFRNYHEKEAWTWEHMALTRARVISGSPAFAARIEAVIRDVLRRPRETSFLAGDVVEMRRAIATEKGEGNPWDLKYVAGGLIDIEFIAQFLQLTHAAERPAILDTSTARVLEKAWREGILAVEDAEILRPAARLHHNLTQVLRLCLTGAFEPKSAGVDLRDLLVGAADVPNFAALEAHLLETEARVRNCFVRVLGDAP